MEADVFEVVYNTLSCECLLNCPLKLYIRIISSGELLTCAYILLIGGKRDAEPIRLVPSQV